MKRRVDLRVLIICFAIVFCVAWLGSLFTDTGEWYEEIKPAITPPNWVFPTAWTIIFFLIALALYFSWTGAKKKDKTRVFAVFAVNLVLNFLWSVFYFGMRNPLLGMADIAFIWLSICGMIFVVWKIDRRAAWMLAPYLAWVSFAAVLNYLSL